MLLKMKQICFVVGRKCSALLTANVGSAGLEEKSRMSEFNLKSDVVDVTSEAGRIGLR